jgi:hypothetical protein
MGMQLTGQWDDLHKVLDPARFRDALRKEVTRTRARIGLRFVREARKAIQEGAYAANSDLTRALKGSSKPLVKDGDLMAALTYQSDTSDPLAVWLGINRRSAGGANVARLLHEGFYLRLTPKAVAYLMHRLREAADKGGESGALARQILSRWQAKPMGGTGSGKLAGNSPAKKRARAIYFGKIRQPVSGKRGGAKRIRVPPRPFITDVIRKPEFVQFVLAEWRSATKRALSAGVAHVAG